MAKRKPTTGQRFRLLGFADQMKQQPSKHERILRDALVARSVYFESQVIMEPYIVDMFFPQWRVVVEVDGPGHLKPKARAYDQRRTRCLLRRRKVGAVLRFSNGEVKRDAGGVITRIIRAGAQVLTGIYEPPEEPELVAKPRARPKVVMPIVRRRRPAS